MGRPYEGVGFFQNAWSNPPAPFNPQFDPLAKARFERVTRSMEADGFYANHTREECKAEWAKRYEAAKALDEGRVQ